jgi:DNA-binding response OmpR family regulator
VPHTAVNGITILLVDTDDARARALEESLTAPSNRVLRVSGGDMAKAVERERPDR